MKQKEATFNRGERSASHAVTKREGHLGKWIRKDDERPFRVLVNVKGPKKKKTAKMTGVCKVT